ncbi:hypothetical protein [Methanobrevibacter smithii]|uniref:hypothetical protein n=1 Tax=Methanobrevibacter smithii TaxID=2173 RepID=UPI0037DCD70C
MTEGIIISLITGILTFAGVIITNLSSNKKVVNDIKIEVTKNQAITDTKIDELTREVREHNNFAKRMPVVEEKISNLENKINIIERVR